MKFLNSIAKFVSSSKITKTLVNLLLIIVIIVLLLLTNEYWTGILDMFWLIIKPFFFGFVIAFVLNPLIDWIQKYIKNRGIAVACVYVGVLAFLLIILIQAIPTIYQSISSMYPSFRSGLSDITIFIKHNFHFDISSFAQQIQSSVLKMIQSESTVNTTLSVINEAVGIVGNVVIYLVLAIYMSITYRNIRRSVKYFSSKIDEGLPVYLKEINISLIQYVKAFAIAAVVQTITTCIMYIIIGHPNWLLLGIFSGIASIIPYIGPIVANCFGAITTLSLGTTQFVILLVLIFIQSTLVSYVIQPKIYSSQIDLSILAVLFGLLSGSTLLGPWGMVIAMPVLVTVKIVFKVYRCHHPLKI